ncbi:hypothetical protein J6590_017963 [Homalodisca vitripennis]|nr:hypothetical protein J6590_017963 [Homalodisca vitripennis]
MEQTVTLPYSPSGAPITKHIHSNKDGSGAENQWALYKQALKQVSLGSMEEFFLRRKFIVNRAHVTGVQSGMVLKGLPI